LNNNFFEALNPVQFGLIQSRNSVILPADQPEVISTILMLSRDVKDDITQVLQAVEQHETVSEESMSRIYQELRRIAAARMAAESAGQTLQATALVHEAWLRLFGSNAGRWQNRSHFFAAAALAMRRILIECARRKMSVKRGERVEHVGIDEMDIAQALPDERILLVDEALERLQKTDAELARVVVLKFFGGLTNVEVAEIMGVTERTVQNKWVFAKAWLVDNIREAVNPGV
jgi:RNA polymerase sigma factor (TIGR02999 family)